MSEVLVSIHDVMPSTLGNVSELLVQCRQNRIRSIALLVVPGMEWSQLEIEQILEWQREGCEIVAHGWRHRAESIRTFYHRLHSSLISREVAEHLSLSTENVYSLMQRSAEWFRELIGCIPSCYIPPAWAMGRIKLASLQSLPFECIETLSGCYLPRINKSTLLPLVGFEADNLFRSTSLSVANAFNRLFWRVGNAPLRIAIHPHDHQLRLKDGLNRWLSEDSSAISYRDFCDRVYSLQ